MQLDRFMDGMLRDAEDFAAKASSSADAESPKQSLRVQLHGEGRILERDIDAKYFFLFHLNLVLRRRLYFVVSQCLHLF